MTTFVSEARIVQKILNPVTGCAEIHDFQYERERRWPRAVSSKEIGLKANGANALAAKLASEGITRTLTSVGFDRPLASEIAREFVNLEDRS